jgi:uncharacterized protein
MTNGRPLRVLSLDGGGMRGTYTATYLDKLAQTFALRRKVGALDIGGAFDLIVGTSTGGIIACALAAGVPLPDVVSFYRDEGPKVFARKVPGLEPSLLCDPWKRPAALASGEQALRSALATRFRGTRMVDIYEKRGIALSITAVEMSQHRSWVFKTAHIPNSNHRDDNYTLADVCLATSAAPVFRSMAAVNHPDGDNQSGFNVFVDGGLWANNPVLVGLVDALDMTKSGDEIQIFSLGTCPVPAGEQIARTDVHRGLPQWKFGADAASLSIDAQQFAFDHIARKLSVHLDRQCRAIRFPSEKVPGALIPYLGLDDTREAAVNALVNQARTDADMTNSRCMNPANADPDARLICELFESAPELTDPLYRLPPRA